MASTGYGKIQTGESIAFDVHLIDRHSKKNKMLNSMISGTNQKYGKKLKRINSWVNLK
jgi:hypothetical protein